MDARKIFSRSSGHKRGLEDSAKNHNQITLGEIGKIAAGFAHFLAQLASFWRKPIRQKIKRDARKCYNHTNAVPYAKRLIQN